MQRLEVNLRMHMFESKPLVHLACSLSLSLSLSTISFAEVLNEVSPQQITSASANRLAQSSLDTISRQPRRGVSTGESQERDASVVQQLREQLPNVAITTDEMGKVVSLINHDGIEIRIEHDEKGRAARFVVVNTDEFIGINYAGESFVAATLSFGRASDGEVLSTRVLGAPLRSNLFNHRKMRCPHMDGCSGDDLDDFLYNMPSPLSAADPWTNPGSFGVSRNPYSHIPSQQTQTQLCIRDCKDRCSDGTTTYGFIAAVAGFFLTPLTSGTLAGLIAINDYSCRQKCDNDAGWICGG